MEKTIRQSISILTFEEGFKPTVYADTEGFPTVGYGLKVGYKDQPLSHFVGYPDMPKIVARCWLESIVKDLDMRLANSAPLQVRAAYNSLSRYPERQSVLLCMAYQLGVFGLANFKETLKSVISGDFESAAEHMLDSLWARQTPARAQRMADFMRMNPVEPERNSIDDASPAEWDALR